MATRKPLVLGASGGVEELAAADGLPGIAYPVGGVRLVAGRFYGVMELGVPAATGLTANKTYFVPVLLAPGTIVSLNFATAAATVAGNVNLGLYNNNTSGLPGTLLASSLAIACVASTAANKQGPLSSSYVWPGGLAWFAFQSDAAMTIMCENNGNANMTAITGTSTLTAALTAVRDGYLSNDTYASGLPASNPTVVSTAQWPRLVAGT